MRRALVLILLLTLLGPPSTRAQMHDFARGQTVVVSFPSKPLRLEPSSNSLVVITVVEGDLLTIIDGDPVQADGLTWWNVETVDGASSGWLPDSVFTALSENVNGGTSCWTADEQAAIHGAPVWSAPPTMTIEPEATYIATITTTAGTIILQLDAAKAPIATNNFVCLANAGYYDGTDFHRVSSDFLIQGGDATDTGTGTPGYVVPSDPTTGRYPAGSVALANAEPDENGAQFFIAVTDLTGKIPDDYPVFGEVISGQDVVADISHAPVEVNPRGERSQPVDPVTIQSIEITVQEDEVGPPLPTAEAIPTTAAPPSPTAEAAPTVAIPPTDSAVIELDAKDIAFVPTEITIDAADEPVTIRITNTGAALHNFTIDALRIDVDVNPGETVDIVIPAGTAPGTYEYYCNVPGHKEAGMVGTLTVEGSPSASSAESSKTCEGLLTYQSQYDQAIFEAFLDNPAATRVFETSDDSGDSIDWLLGLTPYQLSLLADLMSNIASNLQLVDPPTFALEWHRLQIESLRLFEEFFDSAQETGVILASIALDSKSTRLETEFRSVLRASNGCNEFISWATEEALLLDDELGPVSSAFAPGSTPLVIQMYHAVFAQ